MSKYGCTACDIRFDTFEEALPHHNQITGHNICTPPIGCPSCAAKDARIAGLEKELLEAAGVLKRAGDVRVVQGN